MRLRVSNSEDPTILDWFSDLGRVCKRGFLSGISLDEEGCRAETIATISALSLGSNNLTPMVSFANRLQFRGYGKAVICSDRNCESGSQLQHYLSLVMVGIAAFGIAHLGIVSRACVSRVSVGDDRQNSPMTSKRHRS